MNVSSSVSCVACGYSVVAAATNCAECGLAASESRKPRGLYRLPPLTIHLLWIGSWVFVVALAVSVIARTLEEWIDHRNRQIFAEMSKLNSPISWGYPRGVADETLELTREPFNYLYLTASVIFAFPVLLVLRRSNAQRLWDVLDSRVMLLLVVLGVFVSSPLVSRGIGRLLEHDVGPILSCLALMLQFAILVLASGRAARLCLCDCDVGSQHALRRGWIVSVFVLTLLASVVWYSNSTLFWAAQAVDPEWIIGDVPWPSLASLAAPFIARGGAIFLFVLLLCKLAPVCRRMRQEHAAEMSRPVSA